MKHLTNKEVKTMYNINKNKRFETETILYPPCHTPLVIISKKTSPNEQKFSNFSILSFICLQMGTN